ITSTGIYRIKCILTITEPPRRFFDPYNAVFRTHDTTLILTRCSRQAMLTELLEGLMAEAQQDKRATRRFALKLPVAVTYAENGAQELSAQTRDEIGRASCRG